HVYVVSAEGGGPQRRITDANTYSDSGALWTPDGKHLVYLAGSDVGNIGQAGRSTAQLYVVALTREEREPGERGIDNEEEAAQAERNSPRPGGGRGPAAAPANVEVKIDFDRIARRARQLTRSGDAIGSVAVSPDSRSVVFTTSGVEGGRRVQSIWSLSLEGAATPRRLTQAGMATDHGERPTPP